MLTRSDAFRIGGTPIYTPDAPFSVSSEHLQSNAGRSLTGYTVKNTVRYNVRAFEVRYSFMTAQEFREMYALFMQPAEYFRFCYPDAATGWLSEINCYCNSCSYDDTGIGIIRDVVFTVVEA